MMMPSVPSRRKENEFGFSMEKKIHRVDRYVGRAPEKLKPADLSMSVNRVTERILKSRKKKKAGGM